MTKLSDSDSGIATYIITFGVVVVLAAAGVLTWALTKKSSTNNTPSNTSTSLTTTNTAAESACQKAYHDSALCVFAQHTNILAYSYVASGTATSASGIQSSFTIQNDGKGNKEITYSAASGQISSITLDGIQYLQSGAGTTWLEYSAGSTGSTSVPDPTSGFNLNLNSSTPSGVAVTKEGTAPCGNLTCNEYKVVVASTPTATQYVYFDNGSHLLRKWTYANTSTGVSVSMTVTYQTVTIIKPSPVQQITT
jgi:hypothetical protein